MTDNGKTKVKHFTDDFDVHSPGPWNGEISTTNKGTLEIKIRDVNNHLVAEVNELNYHREANLAVIRRATDLLDACKQCANIILSDTKGHTEFLRRLDILIARSESKV